MHPGAALLRRPTTRQGAADCNPGKHEKHGKDHRRNDAVFEHIARLFVIPGPHMVRNLNGKTGRYCGTKAALKAMCW